ncbi:MAG: CAP domain-containing protein [Methanomicrobiales archaeon]
MPTNNCYKIENHVYKLLNISRSQHHVKKMKRIDSMCASARKHSSWMAKTGNFVHSNWGFENIAWIIHPGLSDYAIAKHFHNQWMNSPDHRANILHMSNNQVGIGVVKKGTKFYATQQFSHGSVSNQLPNKIKNQSDSYWLYVTMIVVVLFFILFVYIIS